MSRSTYIVYFIRNKATGQEYVGQTRHPLPMRWGQHKTVAFTSKRSLPLYDAMREHGAAAFEVRVLLRTSDVQEANRRERASIARRKTAAPRGYNVAKGGGAVAVRGELCPHGVHGRTYCKRCRSNNAKRLNRRPGERERKAALYKLNSAKFSARRLASYQERMKQPGVREAKNVASRVAYAKWKARLDAHPRLKRKYRDAENQARRKRFEDPARRNAVNERQRRRYNLLTPTQKIARNKTQSLKVSSDPVAHERRNKYCREYQRKRMKEPAYRAEQNARNRERYARDPTFRAEVIAKSKRQYMKRKFNPALRAAYNAKQRRRYAEDPEYRDRVLAKAQQRYKDDPEFRAKALAKARQQKTDSKLA